jgi:hypothetical protein
MYCHTVIGDLHAIGMDTERITPSEMGGERVWHRLHHLAGQQQTQPGDIDHPQRHSSVCNLRRGPECGQNECEITFSPIGLPLRVLVLRDAGRVCVVQPALWLLIFGQTFSHLHVIDTGSVSDLAFLAPGIIAQSALFISIFHGTPAPASALITGKAFAAGVGSVAQVVGVL